MDVMESLEIWWELNTPSLCRAGVILNARVHMGKRCVHSVYCRCRCECDAGPVVPGGASNLAAAAQCSLLPHTAPQTPTR